MATKRCYYETLEVERTANDGQLKAAFRKLAMKLHPDKNTGDHTAEILFKEINEAYEVLKDPDKRQRFDHERRMAEEVRRREQASGARNAEGQTRAEGDEGAIFSSLWRKMAGQPNTPDKAPDLAVDAQISIEDIFQKTKALVRLPDGRTLRVALPDGVMDGKQVRIAAQGHRINGLKRGDVVVTFRIAPHPVYRADGLDLAPLVEAGRTFFREPRTFDAFREHLAETMTGDDVRAMAYAVRMQLPLLQMPVDSPWGFPAQAGFIGADTWLGRSKGQAATTEALVLRYLAGYGPAGF